MQEEVGTTLLDAAFLLVTDLLGRHLTADAPSTHDVATCPPRHPSGGRAPPPGERGCFVYQARASRTAYEPCTTWGHAGPTFGV